MAEAQSSAGDRLEPPCGEGDFPTASPHADQARWSQEPVDGRLRALVERGQRESAARRKEALERERRARRDVALARQRALPPGVIERLLAQRGFWSLTPSHEDIGVFEVEDLQGTLQIEPSARGVPGTYEAVVFTGLLSLWAGGARERPEVTTSLRGLAELLSLSWGGKTAAELRDAIELLKLTGYRVTVEVPSRGFSRLFSLLDRVETSWSGPPSTPHRHVTAVFSEVVFEAISAPASLRPVDLAALRSLGHQRELAKRLFLLLEGLPAGRLDERREIIERLVDARLAATLGSQVELRELRRLLARAGEAIVANASRYDEVEITPRKKRGLRPGEPRYLLRVVRGRLAPIR